jgi:SAM-dependent methyltransferase
MPRHGWFSIPGIQTGDRSVEEQMMGLSPALPACVGKTVLDIGSAEGLISREFAKAGAKKVVGIELVTDHVRAARKICSGLPVLFVHTELAEWIRTHPEPDQFDIVLILGIAHKLHNPGSCIEFACKSAREMIVFRGPGKDEMYWDGWLGAKFGDNRCHVPTIMKAHGFREGQTLPSARGERAQYWLR